MSNTNQSKEEGSFSGGADLGMTQIPVRTLGRLHDRIAELERDAARYRWLRSDDIEVPQGQREIVVQMLRLPFREDQSDELLTGAELDAAIDAALSSQSEARNGV